MDDGNASELLIFVSFSLHLLSWSMFLPAFILFRSICFFFSLFLVQKLTFIFFCVLSVITKYTHIDITHKLYHPNMTQMLMLHGLFLSYFFTHTHIYIIPYGDALLNAKKITFLKKNSSPEYKKYKRCTD